MSGHDSLSVAPDLAGEPPPTTQLCPDSASGAWPIRNGCGAAVNDAAPARRTATPRCCIPRAAVLPAHVVDLGSISDDVRAQCSRWPPPGARNSAKSPTKDHVRPCLAEDGRRTRSGMPAHRPDVVTVKTIIDYVMIQVINNSFRRHADFGTKDAVARDPIYSLHYSIMNNSFRRHPLKRESDRENLPI